MRPLDGIRVVDLSTYVAVPTAARILSDWGAEVIKIEAPSGDLMRVYGSNQALPITEEENPMFSMPNSGKKLMGVDLKTAEGMGILMKLLETADVFCTNVRLGSINRMGLDYASLHQRFPQLIYLHFNGFGYEGPEAARPGFDATAFWGMTGMAVDWPDRGNAPLRPGPAFGDMVCAFSILSAILGGIIHRGNTGEGLRLTTSLLANGLWCNFAQLIIAQDRYNTVEFPREVDSERNALSCAYQCKNGRWILLQASNTPQKLRDCLTALELEQYLADPRFSDWDRMMTHYREMYRIVTEQMKLRDSDDWAQRLIDADVPYMVMGTTNEASKCEQAWINGYLARVRCANGSEYIAPNSPVTFYGCERVETRQVGAIGSHTREVLARLGYSDEEIDELSGRGVIVVA